MHHPTGTSSTQGQAWTMYHWIGINLFRYPLTTPSIGMGIFVFDLAFILDHIAVLIYNPCLGNDWMMLVVRGAQFCLPFLGFTFCIVGYFFGRLFFNRTCCIMEVFFALYTYWLSSVDLRVTEILSCSESPSDLATKTQFTALETKLNWTVICCLSNHCCQRMR